MRNRLLGLLLGLGCLLFQFGGAIAAAQPDGEENRQLLEKGLTVYELDREIARLTDEEIALNAKIRETSLQVDQAARLVEEHRRKTERVIRSYYTGDRNSLLLALLNVHSIQDALYVWDQLQVLLDNDRQTIDDYRRRYRSLRTAQTELEASRNRLADTKSAYVAEKERRKQAEHDVERLLASSSDRVKLEKELEDVRKQWEQRGLPLFEQYFNALSDAMTKLPELIGQNNKMVTIKGLTPKVTIGDDELNRFLQEKSKALSGFSFRFEDGSITAGGQTGNIAISLKGRYVVENKPSNAVRFVIDSLSFNGYAMPESTAKTLERQYDLAFYPNQLAPFIQASDVKIERGAMTIVLRIGL